MHLKSWNQILKILFKQASGKPMNYWTQLSIEFANQRNYLDELFSVYPTIPEGIRDINEELWEKVEESFNNKNNLDLLQILLKFDLFPIKDSYVAYLRGKNKMYRNITAELSEYNIMSALVLRDFLYQL